MFGPITKVAPTETVQAGRSTRVQQGLQVIPRGSGLMTRQRCVTALNPLQFGPFRIPHHANLIFSLEVKSPVDISTR